MNLEQKRKRNLELCLLWLVTLGMFVFTLIRCDNNIIWCDEAFSINLAHASMKDTLMLTAIDVHPPLYYVVLKIMGRTFGFSGFILHMASFLPFEALVLTTVTLFYKKFGFQASFMLLLLETLLPCSITFSIEIRMYSLAILLVTICFYFAYELIRKADRKNWWLMTLFGIAAAYTHYFAFAAVCVVYACAFITVVMKDKSQVKNCVICAVLSMASYIPWVHYFIAAIKWVNEEYWVTEIPSIWECLSFIFGDGIAGVLLFLVYVIVMLLFVVDLLGIYPKQETKKNILADDEAILIISSFVVGLVVIVFSLSYCVIVRPMLLVRYLYPMTGVVWLGFAVAMARVNKRRVVYAILMLAIVALNVPHIVTTYQNTVQYDKETTETVNYINEEYDDSSILISNLGQLPFLIFEYYLPTKLSEDWDFLDWESIRTFDTVYFFAENEVDDKITNTFHENGFNNIELHKKTHLGWYPVYVYEVTHEKEAEK